MQIVFLADDKQQEEILSKKINANVDLLFEKSFLELFKHKNADVFFILDEKNTDKILKIKSNIPVIINSVTSTLKELKAAENISRINGWHSFLKKNKWEITTNNESFIQDIFEQIGWDIFFVKDEPGLVSARIIAMIINEAYYALGDKVSSKNEIDIAMKLGTNYPYGPFQWSEIIGLKNIYHLLKKLSITDKRYSVSPEMEKEI